MSTLRGKLRGPLGKRLTAALSLVASIGVMGAALVPGMITGVAAGPPDVGNAGVFELDGNVAQNTATPPPYDWSCVFNTPVTANCPPSANPADTATTPTWLGAVFQTDYANPDPSYFSSNGAGVKDIDQLNQWGCTTLNNPLNKDDILNAYGTVFVAQGNSSKAGHELVYLAQERDSNNGDSFAGFWLMHNQHACQNGTFTNPVHDPGDLLIVSNYTNGGGTSTIQLYAWDTTATNNLRMLASGFTCGAASPPPGLVHPEDICGIANSSAFTEPWAPNHILDANQFVETGVDLTALIDQGIFPTPTGPNAGCFNDFLAETRSSQETTATLKDFTTSRFQFCVAPKVTTKQTSGSTTSPGLTVARGASVTDQAFLGAPLSGTPGGSVTYTLYSSSDCTTGAVFTSTKNLSGGTAPPSDPFNTSNLSLGTTYQWQASYSGDTGSGGHNFPSLSTCGDEPLNVIDANITITPQTATNAVGNQHVFTITASVLPSSVALSAATITTSVSPAPTSSSNTCASPTISNNQATCTLTINSSSVASFTADATATLTADGIQLTRSTAAGQNHGPNGSGSAHKNYVDAFITITPATAVNEVGNQHVFTITYTALPGNATPVVFNSITPSISPTPGTMSSTCASPTVNGNVATCTLTIDSSTAGTFTANASGQVTIGGVAITRTTAPDGSAAGPGGSGPAVKHYVDANITIGPNGINPVGQQHVFTIVVTGIPAGTGVPTFSNIAPTVAPQPGTMSTTCGSPVLAGPDGNGNYTATCTLTVDNSLADVFQANASADVTMGGVTVHRATDGTHGSSGPATKTYVDAAIAVSPSSVNEVGHAHTFTVTVTAIPSGASPVVFSSITPAVTPTPDLQNTNTCGSPTVNGDVATCTVTVDNSTAGTFTVNATAVVTMGGTAVTRSTNSQVASHGPGGTGPSTKTFVDAAIALSPLTAVNNVGAPHTVHVTVTAIPSGASPVSFDSITPSVSPTPTSMSTTCGSPSVNGNIATCDITINSDHPATYTIDATAQVTMGGVQVTRSTTGNHGPGGTGSATKIYGQPTIAIAPDAVNEVGHAHTFTVTVTSLPGQTTVFNSITPSVSPTPDLGSTSTCAKPTINANVATCTLTINSDTAGVFTANASATLTVNGFQSTVSTNGQNGNSGPATKTYVDSSIGITPQTAVNEVGNQHVFTITVHGLPANGLTASFSNVVASVSPTPDLQNASTCGSPVVSGNTATCTLTIDSSTAGTFTVKASADVTMGGVTMHRATDGNAGPGGTGPAVKHYVDASVGIGPSAFNPIGQAHVFTIVVTAYPGGASPVSFDSITPSVSPQPLSSSNTCATPTVSNNQATCTLTIDNDLPDTFQANVVATVTMGGVQVTRSTAGNPGPGGTGPATKTYVTANIGLSPLTADDPVGDLHTLTATVTTNNGSGEGQPQPAPNGTVVSFSLVSGPGSLASPSCTITNGLGTCTDVLTSNVAGTSVVNASTTVVVEGVTLHRSTNDSVPGDSVNAVKNWHKVQPSIATTQSAGGTVGVAVNDTASVSGGLDPTGTVTFQLFGPGDTTCSGTPVFISSNQPLSGGKAQSGSFTPTASGTYQWVATYNGDAGNLTAISGCGDEPVTIAAAAVLPISIPNTGAGALEALAEGLTLVLAGTGLVVVARRRRKGN